MAIKFKITGARVAEACNIAEYLLINSGNKETIIRIAPRFIVDDNGEYIVKVKLDNEGDIEGFEGVSEAFTKMAMVTPKRLDKLVKDFQEGANQIVNPPSGADLKEPTNTITEPPPHG